MIDSTEQDTRQKEDPRRKTQDVRQGEGASGLESGVLGLNSSYLSLLR
jgi:hypothetical protein